MSFRPPPALSGASLCYSSSSIFLFSCTVSARFLRKDPNNSLPPPGYCTSLASSAQQQPYLIYAQRLLPPGTPNSFPTPIGRSISAFAQFLRSLSAWLLSPVH